jgi:hypothetical protein
LGSGFGGLIGLAFLLGVLVAINLSLSYVFENRWFLVR